jgi:hypothetical protein
MDNISDLVILDRRADMLFSAGSDGGFWRIRPPPQYLREVITCIVGGSAAFVL